MSYHNKKFKVVSNSDNGELSSSLIFHYKQKGEVLSFSYSDNEGLQGHLLGIVDKQGNINMRYHQINKSGELMTGTCFSKPEKMSNGKVRLHETWQWTSGDKSKGSSILEEI